MDTTLATPAASQVAILVTGGTFDKEYNELNGELFFRQTHVPTMLSLGRCLLPVRIQTLLLIDSLKMTDADREQIARTCIEAKEDRLVITHGTDTIVETAAFLAKRVTGKTIVLTGAMVPYTFGSSDGMFNLGCSLAFAQTLPPGIHVAMNGRCFDWNEVRKNRDKGIFEKI